MYKDNVRILFVWMILESKPDIESVQRFGLLAFVTP